MWEECWRFICYWQESGLSPPHAVLCILLWVQSWFKILCSPQEETLTPLSFFDIKHSYAGIAPNGKGYPFCFGAIYLRVTDNLKSDKTILVALSPVPCQKPTRGSNRYHSSRLFLVRALCRDWYRKENSLIEEKHHSFLSLISNHEQEPIFTESSAKPYCLQ